MPTGGPENSLDSTGTLPSKDCSGICTKRDSTGPNTISPHMPYTMEGTAASNSIAVLKGCLSQRGDISVRNRAMPKLTGTAISNAMADVASVP